MTAAPAAAEHPTGRRLLLTLVGWPVVAAVLIGVTLLVVRALVPDWGQRHRPDVLALVTLEAYAALGVVLLAVNGWWRGLVERLAFRPSGVGGLVLAIGVWLVAVPVGALATAAISPLLGPPQSNAAEILKLSFDPLFIGLLVPTICLLGPFCEELLFRGALQGWLAWRIPGALAIVLAAAAFAGAHLLPPLLPYLFVFGLGAGLVRWWTGSTFNTFLMHVAQNTFAVVATYAVLTSS
ncbi:MAG TPA: CPBP family intramembrane glutamic endopeptidase [Candidatus Binatia bacterium]|nr:CPBP family intramembrane glutamic endopeptidase [Candidatus Binatia bacterium]